MRVQRFKLFLFFLLILFAAPVVYGQGTTGNIVGNVEDPEGRPLPSVTLTLTSPVMIQGKMVDQTDNGGYYRFTNLSPGDYRLEFAMQGFRTLVREGVRVVLGATITINAALQLAPVEETLVLTGETPLLASKETSIGTNFTEAQLQNIPSARDVWALMEMTPAVITDKYSVGGIESGLQSLFSARGGSWTQNQFSLNGVNVTDPSAIGASDFYFDFDTFEEVQVSTGAHSAEVAVPGVYINVVTKSGGNDWHGGAKILYESDALQSTNLDDSLADQFNLPDDQRDKFQTLDYLSDVAAQIGGPLIKDKLWFFGSYRDHRIHRFVPFYPVAEGTDIKYILTKATYQLNTNNTVSGLWARNYYFKPDRGPVDFGGGNVTTESSWIEDDVSDVYQATYTSVFNQNTLMDAKVSYVDLFFPLKLKNATEPHLDLGTGLFSESAYNGYVLERRRLQINASLSYFKDNLLGGKHDFKFGTDIQGSFVDNTIESNGDIAYLDFLGAPFFIVQKNTPVFTKNRIRVISFFAQDAYSIGQLTLNLGARLDLAKGWNPEQSSPGGRFSEARTVEKSRDILDWSNIAPRLSAIYDLMNDGKFLLKGNYSRYYHQIPVDWTDFENFAGYGGRGFFWSDPNGDGVFQEGEVSDADLAFVFGGAFGPGGSGVNFVSEDFNRPFTDEFSIGIDKELARNWLLSVDFIYRQEGDLQEDINQGVPFTSFAPVTVTDPGADGVEGTPDDGGQITVFNQVANFGEDSFLLTNPDGLDSNYKGVEFQLQKRFSDKWQMLAGLTLGRSEGFAKGGGNFIGTSADNGFEGGLFDNPNSLINAEGRLFWDRPFILKLSGSYEAPYEVTLAGFFRAQSGQPFPRQIVVNLDQGPSTIFAEPVGATRFDNVYTLDLRVEKSFTFAQGRLGVSLDVFNIFNSNTVLEADALSGPTYLRPRSILAPRVARVGARFDF